jgi:hypothetical protein
MSEESPTLRSLFDVQEQVAKQRIFEAVDSTVWDRIAIPRTLREAAAEKVAGTLDTLLAVSLGEVVATAFNAYRRYGEYADEKRYPHGKDYEVEEGKFSIESEHTPHVELKVTGLPPQRLEFPVTLALEFSAARLVIRDGKFMALKAGSCIASGKVCCEKVQLFERPSAPVKLPGEIRFGDGIKIYPLPH